MYHSSCFSNNISNIFHFSYFFVALNDVFTAAYSVVLKKKLDANELGKYGLIYYNSLFMLVPAVMIAWQSDNFTEAAGFNQHT